MEQDSLPIESIFDFLYLDYTHIKSFYAQLSGFGSLAALKLTSAEAMTQLKEAVANIPPVFSGKLSGSDHDSKASEHSYDPLPSMPRDIIDRLDELGFIGRDLTAAKMNSLVLLSGKLSISDISLLKDMIDPIVQHEAQQAADLEKNSKSQKRVYEEKMKEGRLIANLLKQIPYSLEASLQLDGGKVWMTLVREHFVGNAHDINLKHGTFLSGEYYVLGVLDAAPNDGNQASMMCDDIRGAVSTMIHELKNLMGKPTDYYGIAPIAIFRVLRPI